MTPLLVADLIVKNPCFDIEEGSLSWWLHGCFLFRVETVLPVLVVTALALGAAWLLSTWKQRQARAA